MDKIIGLLQRRVWIAPLIALILLIVGLVIGLVIGWMTVDFKPSTDDVVSAANALVITNNPALAKRTLRGLSNDELSAMLNKLIAASATDIEANRYKALATALNVPVKGNAVGTPVPSTAGTVAPAGTRAPSGTTTPGTTTPLTGFDPMIVIVIIVVVLILIAIAGLIFITRILPGLRKPRAPRPATGTAPAAPGQAPAQDWAATAPPATTTPGGLGRFVPSYTLGNDNYDTSYSLEAAKGEFLGECGMGISETVGEGKPDKVTAFDLWLFDKADVRTVTQIVMSDFAFKDQTLRTKLAPKGEAILAEKGKTLHLETQSLQIDAHIVELVYATNPSFPPNSHFQKLVVEIVPMLKEAVPAR
jgi:hypothetical protein